MTIQRRIADIAKKATGPALKRGYLAEEYDGIGGSVTIRLSTGSSSGALASVAAGAFGTEQTFPAGTIVTVVEYQGRLEVVSLGSKMAASSVTIDMLPTEGWDASTEDSPVIMSGTLPGSTLVPASLTPLQMADDIRPVAIVDVLPTLPDATYPQGSLVYNRADVPPRLYRTDDALTWVAAINSTDIVANSITAGEMAVGAISSQELFTKLMVANVIRTAESGARVEFGEDGIDLVDDANEVRARLPTDPTLSVYIRGTIEASTLESDSASLGGATSVPAAAVLTAQAGTVKPAAAPVLTKTIPTVVSLPGTYYTSGMGIAWDDLAGTWWVPQTSGSTIIINEINATTGAVIRSKDTGLSTSIYGVAGMAVRTDGATAGIWVGIAGSTARIFRYARTDLSYVGAWTVTVTSLERWTICWNATTSQVIVVTTTGTTLTEQVRLRPYSEAGVAGTIINCTGYTISGSSVNFFGAVFDGTNYWIKLYKTAADAYVRCWNAAGAYQANREFGYNGTTDLTLVGIGWNGTSFVGARVAGGVKYLSTFTDWDWTTESAVYWVGYSWYSSVGPYETQVGPRASITMQRRIALSVQHAARPADATSVFIYAERNATQPAAGGYELQAANGTSDLTVQMATFNAAGGADSTTNSFPSATAAEIRSSASPGWSLKGDGTANFDGVPLTGTDTAFSVVADGTAAYSLKSVDWVKVGRLVTFMLRFSLSANGSGSTTDISIDNDDTGLPKALGGFCVWGDRGGTGVTRIFARAVNGTNYLGFTQIRSIAAPTTNLLGVDLVSGASYTLAGSYISAS